MQSFFTLKKAVRTTLFIVAIAVLGNVIYTSVSSNGAGFSALLNISVNWLFLAIFLSLTPWLVAVLRLGLWGRFFHLDLTPRKLFEIILGNDLAAAATPTAVGGGYAKLGLLVYHGAKPGLAALLMVISSIEEFIAFAFLVPICWILYPPANIDLIEIIAKFTPSSSSLPYIIIILGTIIGALIFLRRTLWVKNLFARLMQKNSRLAKIIIYIKQIIQDFKSAFALISSGGKLFFATNIVLASVQWAMRYCIFTALAFGFGLQPHPVQFFLLQWLLFTLMNIVPTPGAIGGAEVGFALLFKGVVPPELLAISGSAWRFVATYLQLIVAAGIMIFMEKPNKNRQREHDDSIEVKIVGSEHAGFPQPSYHPVITSEPSRFNQNDASV
ncbi:MAG: YbhN family protein [bacterium]